MEVLAEKNGNQLYRQEYFRAIAMRFDIPEDMDIQLTKSRRHHYLGTGDEALVMSRDSFPLRMVRVWLDEDKTEYEILASNLPRDRFPADCFGELYHLR